MPVKRMRRIQAGGRVLLALSLGLAACGGERGTAPPAQIFASDDPRFELAVVDAPAEGASARELRARLTAREPWHLSTEYPVKLAWAGEGVRLARAEQDQADAALLTEQALEFRVGYEPPAKPGARVAGTLRFGICRGAELCQPVVEPFEAAVP